jgi:sulfatase modifying factor 1
MKRTKLGMAILGLIGAVLVIGSAASSQEPLPGAADGEGPIASAILVVPPQKSDDSVEARPSYEKADANTVDPMLTSMAPKMSATPVVADTSGSCPSGMVEVQGDYCPWIEQKCLRWLDPDTKMRCAEFAPTSKCDAKTIHKRFCMDRFEFPNQAGEKPVVMKSWYDAQATCKSEGKRLCGESEWTLACEGQERLPYPYGYSRNADACNIDKPHPDPDENAIANPKTRDAEVARLDQRDPSGSREACVSPYGLHDMTGNVDEWVVNESGHPYKSGLKGGYWGPVRDRCRPMTTAHREDFAFYQIGFRCCEDEPSTAGSSPVAAKIGGEGNGNKVAAPTSGSQVSALAGS